jgi:hypothetical protein
VLAATALDSEQPAAASWARCWDKPLYANERAQRATEVAERIRCTPGLFIDPMNLPENSSCLDGLRAPRLKLDRVRLLGQHWADLHDLHSRAATAARRLLGDGSYDEAVIETRRHLGVPGYRRPDATRTPFDSLTSLHGIGPITSLHLLTDLGYPVYKPDRWVVRFASVDQSCRAELERRLPAGRNLEGLDAAYLLRHLDLVCIAVDLLTSAFRQGPASQGMAMSDLDFRAYRFVDLMVAKFGMKPEESFGLVTSGKDWLLAAPPSEAARFTALQTIAREMQMAFQARRRPNSVGGL